MDRIEDWRDEAIEFCVKAIAELNGVELEEVFRCEFENMNDDELRREESWLSDILDKLAPFAP